MKSKFGYQKESKSHQMERQIKSESKSHSKKKSNDTECQAYSNQGYQPYGDEHENQRKGHFKMACTQTQSST
ncbi:hypothetical protein Tco_0949308 [Tanacetum coccineum]